jgi:hypothetical protein
LSIVVVGLFEKKAGELELFIGREKVEVGRVEGVVVEEVREGKEDSIELNKLVKVIIKF